VVEAGVEVEVVVEGLGFDESEGEGVLHEVDAESADGGGGCVATDQFGGDEEVGFVDESGIEEGAEGLGTAFDEEVGEFASAKVLEECVQVELEVA